MKSTFPLFSKINVFQQGFLKFFRGKWKILSWNSNTTGGAAGPPPLPLPPLVFSPLTIPLFPNPSLPQAMKGFCEEQKPFNRLNVSFIFDKRDVIPTPADAPSELLSLYWDPLVHFKWTRGSWCRRPFWCVKCIFYVFFSFLKQLLKSDFFFVDNNFFSTKNIF